MATVTITFDDTDEEAEIFSVELDGVDPDDEDKTLAQMMGLICFYKIQDHINAMVDVAGESGLEPWYPEDLEDFELDEDEDPAGYGE